MRISYVIIDSKLRNFSRGVRDTAVVTCAPRWDL